MINFSAITAINTAAARTINTNVQAQANEVQQQKAVFNFSSFEQTNSVAALKNQAAISDIKFNNNFYNNIQYLNAKAAAGIHKQVDGKIFIASDVFQSVSTDNKLNTTGLQKRLSDIDNLAKDRNGSQSLFYTNADADKKEQKSEHKMLFA